MYAVYTKGLVSTSVAITYIVLMLGVEMLLSGIGVTTGRLFTCTVYVRESYGAGQYASRSSTLI